MGSLYQQRVFALEELDPETPPFPFGGRVSATSGVTWGLWREGHVLPQWKLCPEAHALLQTCPQPGTPGERRGTEAPLPPASCRPWLLLYATHVVQPGFGIFSARVRSRGQRPGDRRWAVTGSPSLPQKQEFGLFLLVSSPPGSWPHSPPGVGIDDSRCENPPLAWRTGQRKETPLRPVFFWGTRGTSAPPPRPGGKESYSSTHNAAAGAVTRGCSLFFWRLEILGENKVQFNPEIWLIRILRGKEINKK